MRLSGSSPSICQCWLCALTALQVVQLAPRPTLATTNIDGNVNTASDDRTSDGDAINAKSGGTVKEPYDEFSAVSSFAVVTSPQTTRRFFGPGLPAQYDTAVPALRDMLDHYLNDGQTMAFCPASLQGELTNCDLHADPRNGGHKIVVLPETTLPAPGPHDGNAARRQPAAGADLLAFAERGGAVIVSGGALLFDEHGSPLGAFAGGPLGTALGLAWEGTHGAAATEGASLNITRRANPEWWRLLSFDGVHRGASAAPTGTTANVVRELQLVKPTSADTMVLATATLAGGTELPLVTATRVGTEGWLVYTASSSAPVIEAAVNFVLAATGVFLNPGAGGLAGHSPISLAGAPQTGGSGSTATALLSYRAPADPAVSLEGVYRVSIVGSASSGSRVCVQLLGAFAGAHTPSLLRRTVEMATFVAASGSAHFCRCGIRQLVGGQSALAYPAESLTWNQCHSRGVLRWLARLRHFPKRHCHHS
jgi:hypothetical protein